MADEPYYTPGQSDNKPPQSPTEFSPEKPSGPDPVTPLPLAEGSESEKHAQLFALDAASGNFKPVEVTSDGKLKVDAVIETGDIEIGAVEIKNRDTDDRQVVDPDGSAHVTIVEKVNGLPFTTTITRDANGLVMAITESDGNKTKTSTISRNPDDTVASIVESIA